MSVIMNDLKRWSEDRLNDWVGDSLTRYFVAGASEAEAFARVQVSLWKLAAMIFVDTTKATPEEAGEKFEGLIRLIQKERSDAKGQQ